MPDVSDAAADASAGIVETWFGPCFHALHPLPRALYRHGGKLKGAITIACHLIAHRVVEHGKMHARSRHRPRQPTAD